VRTMERLDAHQLLQRTQDWRKTDVDLRQAAPGFSG